MVTPTAAMVAMALVAME
jgi:hypothetical protein